MTRSRLVVFFAAAVVVVGALIGLGAVVLSPARAAVGPLPNEALVLPADTSYVIGLDVKKLVASPFYARQVKDRAGLRPANLGELEARTGLNPERDIERVILAGGKGRSPLALVTGTFDRSKLAGQIQKDRGAVRRPGEALELFTYEDKNGKTSLALGFLGERTLVMGALDAVQVALENQAETRRPLGSNAALLDQLSKLRPGSTFWMVGDETLLSELPRALTSPAAMGPAGERPAQGQTSTSLSLPPLKALTVTGDLDPVVSIHATGTAADPETAGKLADIVRGLVALATLQAQQKPELQALTKDVSITTEGTQVHVSARFSYETLDALNPKPVVSPTSASTSPAPPR